MRDDGEPRSATPLLALCDINKSFGNVHALKGVSLEIVAGQVTALVGDNGAGKSTLIKAIAGISRPDSGELRWKGEPVEIHTPRDAAELGIATVFQDLALCNNLDIVQNLYLGRELVSHGLRNETAMELAAREALANLGIVTVGSVRQPASSLSGGQRQAVAVARAAMVRSDLVILDEPTAALGVAQTEQVLGLIRRLTERGIAVLIISHNLVDVFAVADRIAVLYLGRIVAFGPASDFDTQSTVEFITTGSSSRRPDADASGSGPGEPSAAAASWPAPSRGEAHPAGRPSSFTVGGVSISVPGSDRTTTADGARTAAVDTAPDELRSLVQYAQSWWRQVRTGESGFLPVIGGMIVLIAIFQSLNSNFLSSGNLVNLMTQASSFILFGIAETFVLLLAEIDLSAGYSAGVGATITCLLAASPGNQPWWICILAGLGATTALGGVQGTLVTRLKLPSFVVTLAGLLAWEGLMLLLLDNSSAATGGTVNISNQVLYDIVNGNLSSGISWALAAVLVAGTALFVLTRDRQRRRHGLVTQPVALSALKIAAVAIVAVAVVLICSANRGRPGIPLNGLPYVVPIVLAIVGVCTFVLGRTRFGLYIYAVGGDPEASRRAGIRLAWIRTAGFMLTGLMAGIAGIIYASRLGSMSTSFDGGTLVLYAVAAAVIGGTSLFGGRGKIMAALLGGLIIAAIYNGMGLLGLGAAVQYLITALVLIAAVLVDALSRSARGD